MRVAIPGAGGIGRGYAAFLPHQGHFPVLWSPRHTSTILTADVIAGAAVVI
jgi:ketopantoate reductase